MLYDQIDFKINTIPILHFKKSYMINSIVFIIEITVICMKFNYSLKTYAHKNHMCEHDKSTQNSIREWKRILASPLNLLVLATDRLRLLMLSAPKTLLNAQKRPDNPFSCFLSCFNH